ncbi:MULTISPECIES: efflux RND transporter periplasmic adaptor subunit [unclassified Janthinobacterium]|uniref:efflux RND transporter periplasmic adaptor subunit n=1 Tax=unclassified Janthinobacterium TaxID=2610881 RepID=UPI000347A39E|nr:MULTISPECIES: efflux RND transporter periplasmic adaptor subunit [unclassified Janthinobacterium]MEC5159714.1 membrane fusion protein (multidrug efflux system) [Janthinobacterium sp. CG_S6]
MSIDTPSPAPVRVRRWRAPALALLALAAAGAGWAALQARATPPPAAAKAAPAAVVHELARDDVAAVAAGALSLTLPLSGSLVPLHQATVKAKVSGQVTEAAPREGAAVAAGQVLARLDDAEPRARLAQQQAALDEATARLSLATRHEAKHLTLLQQQYISQSAYDAAQNAVELARAGVQAAAAQRQMARIALADSVIRAPLAGIVSRRHVQPGEKLAPDMPVYSIVDLSRLTLEAQVPAAEIPRVKVGQPVRFQVDGFGGRAFAGAVARINPSAEAGSRAMLVYIAVDNADGALRGGMFAKGGIVTEHAAVAPLLPLAALRGTAAAPLVYAIEDGQVVARAVTLGLRDDDQGYAAVSAGLAAGASVIVSRLDGVKPGQRVIFAAPAAPAPKG